MFVAVGLVVALSYPILVKRLIDEGVLAGAAVAGQRARALLLLVLLVAEGVATVVRDHYFNLAAERVTARLRQRVFDHLLRSGDRLLRQPQRRRAHDPPVTDDVAVINRVVGDKLAGAVRSVLVGVLGTVLLVYTSPILTRCFSCSRCRRSP